MSSSQASPETLHVGWWNTLFDAPVGGHKIGRGQMQRIDDITRELAAQDQPFNIVGLAEINFQNADSTIEKVAMSLGLDNAAFAPNGPYGIAVAADEQFEGLEVLPLDPGHQDRKAVIAWMSGSRAVALVHPSHHLVTGPRKRRRQMKTLLGYLDQVDDAIIAGDLNALPRQQSRKMLEDEGFKSVFETADVPHPPTYPADARTCDIGAPSIVRPLIRGMLMATRVRASIDGAYVRGEHEVRRAEALSAVIPDARSYRKRRVLSDHHGLAVSVEWTGNTQELPQEANDEVAA